MTCAASALLAWLLTASPAPAADTFGIVLAKANVAVALLPGADARARVAVDGPLVFEASVPRATS